MNKVVKTTCFLAEIADFAAFNEVYAKYFTGKPAPFLRRRKRSPERSFVRGGNNRGH